MKIIFVTLFLIVSLSNAQIFTNELINETSPYLQQHAHNPVDWMTWHKEAFERAKKENKPIFLSIGYSTCHWCHVMEKESFTNEKTAALLNKYFISIKVDKEEMPQLDIYYQNIYKKYKKHIGGWPLTVFMTPDKKIFYITTYIPPHRESYAEGFDTLLKRLHLLYEDKNALSKEIFAISNAINLHPKSKKSKNIFSLKTVTRSMKKEYEPIYEGFGRGKKFPQAAKVNLLGNLAQLSHDAELKKDYFAMLDVMVLRGLYDHAEGGFFRYTTDAAWEIPHFEKMLYNQAELIPLYVRGYALSGKKLYRDVVVETLHMVEKRFKYNNLYFSASDADSMGEEGGYFTFTKKEIDKALQNNPHASEIKDAIAFSYEGNFHNKIHINLETQKRPKGFYAFQKALQKIRAEKTYPFIDKKINTAWNSMMIEALYKAAYINMKYAKQADKSLEALELLMIKERELYHQTVPNHKPKQKGLLEDYAFFIGALLASYENSYDDKRLLEAEYFLNRAKEKFYRDGRWYLSEDLGVKADLNDKYYTSAVSKMIQNIITVAALKESFRYEKFAKKSLDTFKVQLQRELSLTPALASASLMQKQGVVVLKSNYSNLMQNLRTIREIKYPYVVTLKKNYNDFLACTIRQCFSKDPKLKSVISAIESFEK